MLALVLALGCPSAATQAPSDTSTTASAGSSSTGSSTGGADTSTTGTFVSAPDGGVLTQCDLYADTCPDGEKCMPYATDGGIRQDATRCVPVAESPAQLDDTCSVQEWVASGLDDCARGLFCVVYDPVELTGRCLAFCIEEPELADLGCLDPNARCFGTPDQIPRLCAADCDPFGSECPEGRGCYKVGDSFVCLDDVSGPSGDYGDPCLFTNECDPGFRCVVPEQFFECGSPNGCCTPFCDTRDEEASAACPGAPEHACVRVFDEGEGPPLFDWVGACMLPDPG